MSDNRYKMFRNFMYNELGITREDIKTWTKEAIHERVDKLVGQMDIAGIATRAARANALQVFNVIKEQVALEIVKKITINIKE